MRLARAASSDPSDEAAARRLDAALVRAGRAADTSERFRFKFQCSRQWTELTRTERPGVKRCDDCHREVHAVQDLPALREAVSQGECVAFPASRLGHVFEGLATDGRLHSAREAKPPCVVPGGQVPERSFASSLPRSMAESLRAAPVGERGEALLFAVVRDAPALLNQLSLATGREVETVLVTEEELAKLIESMPSELVYDELLMGAIMVDSPPELPAASPRESAQRLAAEGRDLAAWNAVASRSAFEQALEADPTYSYAALWLAALFQLPGPLLEHAKGEAWPAPIARCLLRETSARELLALARSTRDEKERRQRLCEAYGYLGAALETRGLGREARGCYRSCVEQGVTEYVEHDWATERLAAPEGRAPWLA